MQECLPPEHGGELVQHPVEQLLDSGGVSYEGSGHFQAPTMKLFHNHHKGRGGKKIKKLDFDAANCS